MPIQFQSPPGINRPFQASAAPPAGTSLGPIYDLHARMRGAGPGRLGQRHPGSAEQKAIRQQKIAARQAEKAAGRQERRAAAAPPAPTVPSVPGPVTSGPFIPAPPTTPVEGRV